MALSIATDTSQLLASKSSFANSIKVNEAMERLSSGLRINAASDDAAGVAVATRIQSSVTAMGMAIRNATDGQSMIDTAEGALVEVTNILQRMRELSVQAANGTFSTTDRDMIQVEMDQLTTEIDRIAVSTQWAGQSFFNGTNSASTLATDHSEKFTASFQIGPTPNDADNISVDFHAITSEALGVSGGVKSPTVSTSVTGASATNVIEAVASSDTAGTIEIKSAFVAGDTYSIKINGHSISITAADDDGFENSTAGLNQQLAAKINTDSHPVTGGSLGFNAVYNSSSGKIDVSYGNPVIDELVQDPNDTATPPATSLSLSGTTATFEDTTEGRTYGLTVNGTSFTFTPTSSDAYTDNATGYAEGAKAALEAALATANKTGVTVAASVVSDKATLDITSKLTFTDATSTATSNTATLISTTESSDPSLGEKVTVAGTLTANDSFSITIDGNTFTAVYEEDDGYANSTAGVAAQLIAKINDADIAGLTVTDNEDGSFILAKGGALTVDSATNSHAAIAAIDGALQILSGDRANFGALSNRFTSAISNLTNVAANAEMSLGRLQDADFAAETSKLTTGRILEQASIAMMAQANAAKQNVLQLLG